MIKWILQDSLRTLKSRKSFLLLAVVAISMISFVMTYDVSPEIPDYVPEHLIQEYKDKQLYDVISSLYDQFPYITDEETYNTYNVDTFQELFQQLVDETDLSEKYKIRLYLLDLGSDSFFEYYESLEAGSHMDKTIAEKAINVELIKEIKNKIKTEIAPDFKPFVFENDYSGAISNYNRIAIDLYETMISYENSYPQDVDYVLTSSFFVAGYISNYFLLIVLVGALLIFDSYYRDFKSGVFKTILSSPTRRYRYIMMKSLSSIISIAAIIFGPMLIVSLFLRFTVGYDTPNYPVYISRTTLNSMDPVLKYSHIINAEKSSLFYSRYQDFCTVGPITKFPVDVIAPQFGVSPSCESQFPALNITFMSLSKFITITLLYLFLIFTFLAALNTLFSLTINSATINMTILGVIILLSVFTSQMFIGNKLLQFLPLTFISPIALLLGTVPYTLLNGVITISVWTIILLLINYIITKRKDFTY